MALADFQQLVNDMVTDQDATIPADVRNRAIEEARVRYSDDLPHEAVDDVTWAVQGVFGPVPPGWGDASRVQSAEYPIGQRPAAFVFADAYRTPGTPTGWGLECVKALPAGAVVRISYTQPHVIDDAVDTVPLPHRLPVAQYAAYLLCQQLATRYSGERETAVGAELAKTETRARSYAARAKEYRSAYYAGTGQSDPFKQAEKGKDLAAASAVASWPRRNPRYRLVRGAQ